MKHFNPNITKAIYSLWENDLNMKPVSLDSKVECLNTIDCYEFNGNYLRLDSFFDNDELTYCVEWASTINDAQNNIFEDAYLYGEDLGLESILSEMKSDILSEIEE